MVIVKTCLVALLVQAVNLPLVVCHVTKGTMAPNKKCMKINDYIKEF